MNKKSFIERKESLISLIEENLAKTHISEQDRMSFIKLLTSLNQYSFEIRLQQKGLLSHTVIDSLDLDYSLAEKFIQFDNDIN